MRSNPYRIEYEEHDGVKYPTFVFFVRKPSRADFTRLTTETAYQITGPAQDKSGCVFQVFPFKTWQGEQA